MSEIICGRCSVAIALGGSRDSGQIRPWLPVAAAPESNHEHAPTIRHEDIIFS